MEKNKVLILTYRGYCDIIASAIMHLTKGEAMEKYLNANNFEHLTLKNSDGTSQRFRRNGANKLWKSRPSEFLIPVKRGLKEYGYINQDNMGEFRPC